MLPAADAAAWQGFVDALVAERRVVVARYGEGRRAFVSCERAPLVRTALGEAYGPLFDRYGVDLVMAGHSHNYERSILLRNHYGLISIGCKQQKW